MYFSKIEIKNYGCIKNFEYQFRFDSNGNPIPCVLIGENGKGKTLVLANLVDSLVEFKRSVYGEHIQETTENKYFKIGSQNYINSNASFSRVMIEMDCRGQTSRLIDIMSKNPEQDISQFQTSEIQSVEDFKTDGFSKKTDCKLKRKDFADYISLYFPVDRYYYPMWFNRGNQGLYHTEEITDIHSSKSNLIKSNLLKEIKEWLTEVFLDKTVQQLQINNDESVPEMLRGKTVLIPQENAMQRVVSNIFSVVKGVSVNSPTGISRKSKMLSFSSSVSFCNDISQLSDGEMNLVCMALAIVKEWDIYHNAENLSEIKGTVIVDEVDAGLHIDYAYRALPKLMKLFPKVQFILTSHSPFFLSGLVNEYGENADILTMPDGLKITDISAFGEMKKAQDLFVESVDAIRNNQLKLTEEIGNLKKQSDKIIIYTEGKTDVKYLKLVFSKFEEYADIADKVEYYDIEHAKETGDGELKKIFDYLQKGSDNNIKICIFDRDVPTQIINEEFQSAPNKVYRFNIPIPPHRHEDDKIAIEHYLTDTDLSMVDSNGKKIFLAKEFDSKGISLDGKYMHQHAKSHSDKKYDPLEIINGSGDKRVYSTKPDDETNYAMSKDDLVTHIENEDHGFSFNLDSFKLILDVIRKIYNHANL